MSGIYGFSYKGSEGAQRMLHALDVWNRCYGREKSGQSLSGSFGIGCHTEHLSEQYPCRDPILSGAYGRAVIDGVIYNREEIGNTLFIEDMSSVSDEEILLRLITEKGYASLVSVNGDFAGAVYDEDNKTWTLFRDHMGIRPLFYYIDRQMFAFSTDIRGLAALPDADRRINEEKFYSHMAGYGDMSLCETEYAAIRCISPASWTVIRQSEEGFSVEEHIYWRLGQKKIHFRKDEEYQEELRRLVIDAVKRRLDAVSGLVGAELSGGLDSSVLAILIGRLGREGRYFSWSYSPCDLPLQEDDERNIIYDICAQEHIQCQFSEKPANSRQKEIEGLLRSVLPPYINTLNLSAGCAWLNGQGARVVFSGHGGDEGVSHRCSLFELWYHREYFAFGKALYRQTKGKKLRLLRTMKRLAYQLMVMAPALKQPFYSPQNAAGYLNQDFKRRMEKKVKKQPLYFAYDAAAYIMQGGSRMRLDNVALQGAENGVRYMLPFLDYRVIDFAVSIPRAQYQNGLGNRWIYRKAFEDIMPRSLQELNSKDTPSLRADQPMKEELCEDFRKIAKQLLHDLDREFWRDYLDFTAIEGLALAENYTVEDYDTAAAAMDELIYCAMLQGVAQKSGKWCDEHE